MRYLYLYIFVSLGCAGRTELPDNLKSMFRPVSMTFPDTALIAEIVLFGEGFQDTHLLAKKVSLGSSFIVTCNFELLTYPNYRVVYVLSGVHIV
jgi:hypothetical protein